MGRDETKKVYLFFKFEDGKSICNVCGLRLSGKHVTNLRRHLSSQHSGLLEDFNANENAKHVHKKRKICIETNEEIITSSLVKIVSSDGRPFRLLDSEGFRNIMNPIYDALAMNHITSRNIMDHVKEKELSIRHDIKSLAKGKLISLKIDVATRLDKAILGVNLQLINSSMEKSEVIIKTLGMIQLYESHTGRYIKERIVEILQEYEIDIENVYSITSDNGKNMIKAIEILNDEATEQSLFEDDCSSDVLMEKLDSINVSNVHLVRCAVHTLQLCVYDVNKRSDISDNINNCRKLCKTLRTETHRRTLMEHKQNIPILDVATRWNSTFTMLKTLMKLREFLAAESIPTMSIDWDWIELYVDAFKDTFEATMRLQHEQLLYSDFFILWMELRLKCENSENYIAQMIIDQLKVREEFGIAIWRRIDKSLRRSTICRYN